MPDNKSSTTTQKMEPWKPIQPYLEDAAESNQQNYNAGMFTPKPLGGSFSDEALQSMQMTMDRANAGAPGIDKASGYLSQLMSPYKTLGIFQRPYDQMKNFTGTIANDVLDDVIPAAVGQFAGAGMPNSTLAMDTVGDAASTAVTNAVAPYYNAALDRTAQMYNSALDRGVQAAGMAPAMYQAGFMPAQMIGQVGSQIDAMDEALANAPMQGFQQYLSNTMGLGGMGSAGSVTQPGASTAQQIGSAGLTGLGTYGMLAGAGMGGPLGIAGAGLAGLLALLE